MQRVSLIIVLIALATLGTAAMAPAQEPDEDLDKDEWFTFSVEEQGAVEEYLDILAELQEVLDGYNDYLEDLDEGPALAEIISVDDLEGGLADGSFADDPEALLNEIYAVIADIRRLEEGKTGEKASLSPRGRRVLRNFRRELGIMSELVEEYNDEQSVQVLKNEEIKQYIVVAIDKLMDATMQSDELLKALQDINLPGEVPTYVSPPTPPDVPPPPAPPFSEEYWKEWTDEDKQEALGTVRQFTGYINVSSSNRPVVITNPTGGLHITGWDNPEVSATLRIEINAESRKKEKEFMDNISLVVIDADENYQVKIDHPTTSETRGRVLRSLLAVNVPRDNHVILNNSLGDVYVENLSGGVDVKSSYSNVRLTDISGGASVENSMGPTMIVDVSGPITTVNSYAPITVTGCDSEFDIKNSYDVITLSKNRGHAKISNSGAINIDDHSGRLEVENLYGVINLNNIKGDVEVSNGYQPLIVTRVTGSADLRNAYSQITVQDINGNVAASNNYGGISTERINGSVMLKGDNSNISIILDRDLNGESKISSFSGTVTLSVDEPADLLLQASTKNGEIIGHLPIKITENGPTKLTELKLGNGTNKVELTASNSAIIIDRRH